MVDRGDRVHARLRELGLTEEDAAEEAGIHRTTWSRVMNSSSGGRADTLLRMARALQWSVEELVGNGDKCSDFAQEGEVKM